MFIFIEYGHLFTSRSTQAWEWERENRLLLDIEKQEESRVISPGKDQKERLCEFARTSFRQLAFCDTSDFAIRSGISLL